MTKTISALLAGTFILSMVGCATARPITGPDGTQHQMVSCPAVEMCYEKAREACGGNYQIVNTTAQVRGNSERTSTQTKMLVKCHR